ncbi:MAG TPA: porin [Pseudomonas sp.]|uniref:porin n=1 Tax=Pseudomonas sp. TaxID=306 RepID=UPI002ED92473
MWNVQYAWQFGNGLSLSVGVDEQSASNRVGLYSAGQALTALNTYTTNYNGSNAPVGGSFAPGSYYGGGVDIVGNLKLDQAWGLIQLSGAAHQLQSSYADGALAATGTAESKWGYAVNLGLQIKNLPTGPGDDIKFSVGYTEGALRYIMGTSPATPTSLGLYGSSTGTNIATAPITDGVWGGLAGNQIQLTKGFGLNGGFNHNWNANWSSSVFGSYTQVRYNDTAASVLATAWAPSAAARGSVIYNPDFNISQVGVVTSWTPVKGLTFAGEAMYTNIDSQIKGVTGAGFNPGAPRSPGVYTLGSQDVWSGSLRVQRNF